MQELPGVVKSPPKQGNVTRPDYLYIAKKPEDVQAAVRFAGKYNIRLAIINSGHDFLGRNDAPNGLWLSVGNLKGVRVGHHYNVSAAGAPPVEYDAHPVQRVNTIQVPSGQQAVVTFGAGVSSRELVDALDKSNLFTIVAADPTVKPAGGYVQTAGYGPVTSKYGLAADNVLEFKVVTADGALRIANDANEKDLFWALRGGGGGTFGVVVEATFRAWPSPKISSSRWWISTTNPNDTEGIFKPAAYLHSQFSQLNSKGVQGYYYIYPSSMLGRFLLAEDDGGLEKSTQLWSPVLAKLSGFPGLKQEIHQHRLFPSFKAWFDYTFPPTQPSNSSTVSKLEGASPQGLAPMDSKLLSASHLASPELARALQEAFPKAPGAMLRGHLVAGGEVARGGSGTSVLPAWRTSLVHLIGTATGPSNVTGLKRLAPDSGCYANECSMQENNYKQTMWGSNYDRLYSIKTRYDPNRVFWVTLGVGADDFVVSDGRLCRIDGSSSHKPSGTVDNPLGNAPQIDHHNFRSGGGPPYIPFPKSQEEADKEL